MTKQEKTKATKEANRIYKLFLHNMKSHNLAFTGSIIALGLLIVNSEGEKVKFWQNVKERLYFFHYREDNN